MVSRRLREPEGRYLEHSTDVVVRFQEVDSLRVVWHGHYVSYFEDARVAFGRRYGIGYEDLMRARLAAPVAKLECQYLEPARFGDELTVTARLYERESAKLEFFYTVTRKADSTLLAIATTVQAFSDHETNIVLTMPEIMREFYENWSESMVDAGD